MTEKNLLGLALKRPTGEIMPMFIHRSKHFVIQAIAEHYLTCFEFSYRLRTMGKIDFDVVRFEFSVIEPN